MTSPSHCVTSHVLLQWCGSERSFTDLAACCSPALLRGRARPGEREVRRADPQLGLYLARPPQGPGWGGDDPRWVLRSSFSSAVTLPEVGEKR